MNILAIETSCDETALALVKADGDINTPSFEVLGTALNSQIDIHKEYGGVFPALAKREHAKNIVPLLEVLFSDNRLSEFISESPMDPETSSGSREKESSRNMSSQDIDWNEVQKILEREPDTYEQLKTYIETHTRPDIDMIAVTAGPGLEPALWVGINVARALSLIWNIPLLPVNHMEGHLASVLLNHSVSTFPALGLLISGGHTELIVTEKWGSYEKIGQTLDDAVGEAYDKVARMLDLPYPGGPEISRLAEIGRGDSCLRRNDSAISLPRPMQHSKDFNFSFSGLKTAALYAVQDIGTLSETDKIQIATEFEQAVTDVLITKTQKAIEQYNVQTLIVGGGVIANTYIRAALQTSADKHGVTAHFPEQSLSTDNAVMIALAGYIEQHFKTPTVCPDIQAQGNWSVANL